MNNGNNPIRRILATLAVALMAMMAVAGVSTAEADAAPDVTLEAANIEWDIGIFIPVNWSPMYNNYFQCVSYSGNHYIYTDFVDWNDPDQNLDVDMVAYTGVGLRYVELDVSNSGGHGVFFWKDISNLNGMTDGWVRATDPHGASSGWVSVSC